MWESYDQMRDDVVTEEVYSMIENESMISAVIFHNVKFCKVLLWCKKVT